MELEEPSPLLVPSVPLVVPLLVVPLVVVSVPVEEFDVADVEPPSSVEVALVDVWVPELLQAAIPPKPRTETLPAAAAPIVSERIRRVALSGSAGLMPCSFMGASLPAVTLRVGYAAALEPTGWPARRDRWAPNEQ